MTGPRIKFLVASPHGDVTVDTNRLHLPLECDPLNTPYAVYFRSIGDFLEKNGFEQIIGSASTKYGGDVKIEDLSEIIVRTEKHGALYHPASVEVIIKGTRLKFGLNVAVSETGRGWLKKEYEVIKRINSKFNLPYLPGVYLFDDQGAVSFLLEDWFEEYHEFHLSLTDSGTHCIKLWEYGTGDRFLSQKQSFEIYRQASKILTLYYDINDFSQIFPWHHSAGDFIARIEDDEVDLRLTTARQYEPYMVFQDSDGLNPILALFFFFLNLTFKMRLDKLDGVGDTVWAEDFCIDATLRGFFEALKMKENLSEGGADFLDLLKSFRTEDLRATYQSLIDTYSGTADYPVIVANLDEHVTALQTTLRNFP